jgi:hypothetical protein
MVGGHAHTGRRAVAGLEAGAPSFGRVPLTAATVTGMSETRLRESVRGRLRDDEEGE